MRVLFRDMGILKLQLRKTKLALIECRRKIKTDSKMLTDLLAWDHNTPLMLLHSPSWLQATKYPYREKQYVRFCSYVKKEHPVRVDLTSCSSLLLLCKMLDEKKSSNCGRLLIGYFYCLIRSFLLKQKGTSLPSYDLLPFSPFSLFIWDVTIRDKKFTQLTSKQELSSRNEYRKLVYGLAKDHLHYLPDLLSLVRNVFLKKSIGAISVFQMSYECQALLELANESNLPVRMFETTHYTAISIKPLSVPYFSRIAHKIRETAWGCSYSKRELDQAENEIKKRLYGEYSTPTFGYMQGVGLETKKIDAPRGTCILFLHCFTDASNSSVQKSDQRTFADYFEHALFVVEQTAKLKIPLIIKPHPSNKNYPNDRALLAFLKKRSEELASDADWYVQWIDDDASNSSLLSLDKPFAITVRGTVMQECGYLGIPIAATTDNIRSKFTFSKLVTTEEDFIKYIQSPYESYDENKARIDAIRLQAALRKMSWPERPACIDVYATNPGELSLSEMDELLTRMVEV